MKKAPALPLFGDAYLADTRHLTLEEHGAYLQLLLIAWRSEGCRLPNDDKRLAQMLGITAKRWDKIKPTVMAFWELTEDGWEQGRLTKERQFVAKKSEQNAEAANARWSAKSLENKEPANANASPMQCERNAPSPSPSKEEEKEEKKPADAGLAFVGKVIRLTQADFAKWQRAYPAVELVAYLQARDDWLASEADEKTRRKWFLSTSNHLANLQQKLRGTVKPAVPI
jgi:uncharacterized protein YdaU (DUF1376 family)